MIFIDADAFIGLYWKHDSHHTDALRLQDEIQKNKEKTITSWDVIDEVTTKTSYFLTKNIAEEFLKQIFLSDTQIEFVDSELAQEALTIFKSQTSKKTSLTDCINMAIARKYKVKTFFSFDQIYEKNGFKLLYVS